MIWSQPHVNLAYVNRDQGAASVIETIETAKEPEAVTVEIPHASLIEMNRDNRMYQWRAIADASIGRM